MTGSLVTPGDAPAASGQVSGDESSDDAQLTLGPLLRYVGTTTATVGVETDAPTVVEALGHRSNTFQVFGHHYAIVLIEGLEPGSITPYEVRLQGRTVWPPHDGRPGCAIRTREGERQARLVFGSCRVGAPEEPPYTLAPSDHRLGLGVDALWVYSRHLQSESAGWPDGLLLMGDQVYVDEVPSGDGGVHPWTSGRRRASGVAGRRFRGVHQALSD